MTVLAIPLRFVGLRLFAAVGASVALSPIGVCRAQSLTDAPPSGPLLSQPWVGTWATAPQLTEPGNLPPTPPGLTDTTLRQIVRVSIGGSRLRVRFSNAFGTVPLTLTSVHIALSAGGGTIVPGTDVPLTFSGSPSVSIPTGAPMVSDPVKFTLAAASALAISLHVADTKSAITGHPGSRTTSYLIRGDSVSAMRLPATTVTTEHWYYINGIDVLMDSNSAVMAAVATIGDSLTDGRGSTTDHNDRWPDRLAQRLLADRRTAGKIGVLNLGIGGNRVLHDGLGPSAVARLDRDVLEQSGVRWLIVWEGINDLGTHSANADQLIAAYGQIITRSHARDIRVFGATLTPCGSSFYFSPALEAERQKINAWIRSSGRFDAVLDFDAALRDPERPDHLLAAADAGDHLHLNPVGYSLVADTIDLDLFNKGL